MRPGIVLVHYRTPELARDCVRALRTDCTKAGLQAEIVIVDNGSTPQGREILASLDVRLLDPGTNLGYGAGANLGIDAVPGDPVVVLNPDVLVRPGCLGALFETLETGTEGGVGIAGPLFFWDQNERMMLPPLEPAGFAAEVRAALGRGGRPGARPARVRWRSHARRHWTAREPLPSYSLSGALLAFTRRTRRRVGPFDPGYRLYFEETDWLERARRLGVAARYVPDARAIHLYDQSAGGEPAAPGWFAASRERFRRRHYGRLAAAVLHGVERMLPPAPADPREPACGELRLPTANAVDARPLWVEISPDPAGFPAAAERLSAPSSAPWRLPLEVDRRIGRGILWATITDDAGRELASEPLACGGPPAGSTRGGA